MKQLSYQRGKEELVSDDGTTFGHDENGEGFIASLSDASEISLSSLRRALGRFAVDYHMNRTRLLVVDMPASRLDDDVLMDPTDLVWEQDELRVARYVVFADEAPTSAELAARIQDLLARRGQTLSGISRYQEKDLWIVTVKVGLKRRGKTIASAVELADEVEALVAGSLADMATVAALVKAGQAHLLIGSYESDWLEAKSAPYRNVPADEIELAKDVATCANGNGGLLLIGLKTSGMVAVTGSVLSTSAPLIERRLTGTAA